MRIIRNESERELVLPRRGTKLSECLGTVASLYPKEVTTKEVSATMMGDASEVASQLAVLGHKGLVEVAVNGRGHVGGSTWKLTKRAIKILKIH